MLTTFLSTTGFFEAHRKFSKQNKESNAVTVFLVLETILGFSKTAESVT